MRQKLGGFIPSRRTETKALEIPDTASFAKFNDEVTRETSTTMIFVRILSQLLRDKSIGKKIVPIVPDEARTFGMEGLFKQVGIYSTEGQKYIPQDAEQMTSYYESKSGQILQEGINEAGAFSAWLAAATSYTSHNEPMIPFYIYYSIFGFQRIGDLAYLAGDQAAKGFLLGATAGRTTLAGEGLQHCDGHSFVLASTYPRCRSFDPAFGYEVAAIIAYGLDEMFVRKEAKHYYISLSNENILHPAKPEGISNQDIVSGLYHLRKQEAGENKKGEVALVGSGTIMVEVMRAQEILQGLGIASSLWSATSFNELAREAQELEYKAMQSQQPQPKSRIQEQLGAIEQPIILATDYMRNYAAQIVPYLPGQKIYTLGTDGYGRSDTRPKLRRFFHVDAASIAYTALYSLSQEGLVSQDELRDFQAQHGLDASKNYSLYS